MIVPDTPSDLGLLFPSWRPHQQQAVQDVIDAYQECPVVLLSAPTGSGKTIIGAGAARTLEGNSLFLSQTIKLQHQQLNTLPAAETATGRRNHPCVMADPLTDRPVEGLTAAEAPCKCAHSWDDCPYYGQYFRCADAQDVVLNYAYATRVLQAKRIKVDDEPMVNPFRGRDLMVCDEGHLLERALVDADGVQVSRRAFKRVGLDLPEARDVSGWSDWAKEHVAELGDRLMGALDALRATPSNAALRQEVGRLRSTTETLNKLRDVRSSEAPYFVGRTEHGYQVRPLWVWGRSHDLLFRHSPRILIMSATLGDPALLSRLLGLKASVHFEVPSTFPLVNRPVYYWPVAKMRHGMPDSEKFRQVQALDYLARLFPTTPGVVHCNSFALGAFLLRGLNEHFPETAHRVVGHRAGEAGLVQAFEADPGNRILISPSVTTGVDWDFVGWAMIPKVPYPDLGDDIVRLRFEYVTEEGEPIGKQVYQQDAAVTVVQAAGRHVRTERSKGVTVITDRAFWPLYQYMAPQAFPQWFREAVSWWQPKEG